MHKLQKRKKKNEREKKGLQSADLQINNLLHRELISQLRHRQYQKCSLPGTYSAIPDLLMDYSRMSHYMDRMLNCSLEL